MADARRPPDLVAARSRPRARRRPLEPAARRGAARRAAPVQRARRGAARHRAEHPDRPPPPPRARADRRRDAVPAAAAADVVRPDRRRPRPGVGAAAARRLGRRGSADGADPTRHELCGTPLETRWYCPTCDVADRPIRTSARPGRSEALHSGYTRARWTTRAGNRACRSSTARPCRAAGVPAAEPPGPAAAVRAGGRPDAAPAALHQLLSVIVLICGAIAITALELGAPLGSPLVKLCVLIAAPLLVVTTADASSASGARPGRGCRSIGRRAGSGSPGSSVSLIGLAALVGGSDRSSCWPDGRWHRWTTSTAGRDGRSTRPPVRAAASRPGWPPRSTSARAAARRSASARSRARTAIGWPARRAATSPTSTRGSS